MAFLVSYTKSARIFHLGLAITHRGDNLAPEVEVKGPLLLGNTLLGAAVSFKLHLDSCCAHLPDLAENEIWSSVMSRLGSPWMSGVLI